MWRSMVRKGRNCTIKIVVVGFEVLDSIYLTVHYRLFAFEGVGVVGGVGRVVAG